MKYVKIVDGVVVQSQPNEEVGFIEAEDSVVCGMLHDGTTFSVPSPSTEALLLKAKKERDEGKELPITIEGLGTFDADKQSQDNINYTIDEWDAMQAALGNPGTIDWILADNTKVALTKEQLQSVKTALVLRAMTLHHTYTAYKESL